jgi:Cep192 domain 4
VKGDYFETDNCGSSLAPGSSCTLNVTFKPKAVGFDQGSITITYTVGQTQIIYLRGTGQ